MEGKMQNVVWFLELLFLGVIAASVTEHGEAPVNIWPMPKSVSKGFKSVHVSPNFQLMTEGTKYSDASGILKEGFARMLDVIKVAHVVDANFSSPVLLKGIHVVISSTNDQLQYGIDESYKLLAPSPEKPDYAHLEAQTVYGALHGLETFSQLCHFDFKTRVIEVHNVPWTIVESLTGGC